MDDHVPTPFPLIHVDLNHEPSLTHDFFFPNHSDHHHTHRANLDDKFIIAQGGRRDHPLHGHDHDYGHDHDHGHPQEYCSVKWMSSKTRIMKKMTGGGKPSAVHNLGSDPNHKGSSMIPPRTREILENDSSSSANSNRSSGSGIESNNSPTIIRVCADCNTTKTPLWRSGPTGPKTLCNACGIRQRKARRAMAAAAAAANGEVPPQPNPAPMKLKQTKKKMKKKRSSSSDNDDYNNGGDPQPKKKLKTLHPPVGSSRKLCFEEFVLKLSEWISDFRGVFPQDEKEAAILLMALSYGLVRTDKLS